MKKSRLESLAILAAFAIAWKRLDLKPGVITEIREISLKPDGTCPAGWVKAGNRCIRL